MICIISKPKNLAYIPIFTILSVKYFSNVEWLKKLLISFNSHNVNYAKPKGPQITSIVCDTLQLQAYSTEKYGNCKGSWILNIKR